MAIRTFKCANTEALFRLLRVARFANIERPSDAEDVEIVDYH